MRSRADEVEADVPVTSSEAHLDLLLAEELAVNSQFLRRFLDPVWDATDADPMADGLSAAVRLNVWDDGGPGCVVADAGENDIDVVVTVGSHTMRVLVEDKVWAGFQPDQGERYRRCADSRGDTTVLIAPRSRLSHSAHADCFDVTYAIEDLAGWLDEQAGGWLYFSSPSGLIYKASHGRVDLYVAGHGYTGTIEDLEAAVATGWGPDRFVAAVDTKGNPVLRFEEPAILASITRRTGGSARAAWPCRPLP